MKPTTQTGLKEKSSGTPVYFRVPGSTSQKTAPTPTSSAAGPPESKVVTRAEPTKQRESQADRVDKVAALLQFPRIANPFYPRELEDKPRLSPGLRSGCYVLCYTPDTPDEGRRYEGTFRVQHLDGALQPRPHGAQDGEHILASGDLYAHDSESAGEAWPPVKIPIFSRADYRFYLCLKSIPDWSINAQGFKMVLESHRFLRDKLTWKNEGLFQADMKWTQPRAGYPFDYLEGDVFEGPDRRNGRLSLIWISEYLRQGLVEIDRINDVKQGPGEGQQTWEKTFEKVGWQMAVAPSDSQVRPGPAGPWTEGALREAMVRFSAGHDPDREWRYYLLCVGQISPNLRGITYYLPNADFYNEGEEVAAIAAGYVFPKGDPLYRALPKNAQGETELDKTSLYFRTAVHEIGHAMSLEHNTADHGFMNTTEVLAQDAQREGKNFDESYPQFDFSPGDAQRLRHWPDIIVRPGTLIDSSRLPSNSVAVFPENQDDVGAKPAPKNIDANGLSFQVSLVPGLRAFPIGAPVRVQLQLQNLSPDKIETMPVRLSLKSGTVAGRVTGPDKVVRTFSAVADYVDFTQVHVLEKGARQAGSLTLLHGDTQPLFPAPGDYHVEVDILWQPGRRDVYARAEARVTITPALDEAHAEAARRVLAEEDLLLTLALGGSAFPSGNEALDLALKTEQLRSHFAFTQFRVLTQSPGRKGDDLNTACQYLLDRKDSIVLGANEIIDAMERIERAFDQNTRPGLIENVARWLSEKAEMLGADEETTQRPQRFINQLDEASALLKARRTKAAVEEALIQTKGKTLDLAKRGAGAGKVAREAEVEKLMKGFLEAIDNRSAKALRTKAQDLEKKIKGNKATLADKLLSALIQGQLQADQLDGNQEMGV